MNETNEITMELLTDIKSVLDSVARDLMPLVQFTVTTQTQPPAVVLRVPGQTNKPIEALLQELAEATRDVIDQTIPSLPLRYLVVGGSEAAGIEVTLQPGAEPVYGHIIKAKAEHLFAANFLRNKPRLLDEMLKGGSPRLKGSAPSVQ